MSAFRTLLHLSWMRLSEQPVRIIGLVVTLAVAVLAWTVLSALASPFLASQSGKALNARLSVVNAQKSGNEFPLRFANHIEQMPDVAAIAYQTHANFDCADGRTIVTINAYGGSGALALLRSFGASTDDLKVLNTTRDGLLIGSEVARQCGLKPGMSLSPRDSFTNVEIPITIVAVLPDNLDSPVANRIAFGQYDYINQLLPEQERDQIRFINVTGNAPSRLPQLAETIEKEFASSDPPLEARVSSGTSSLLGRFGQVQSLLGLVMAAMAACALLVFLTVLAHQIAQRRASMATLQTIGFDRGLQFSGLIMELTLIILAGTALGLLAGHAALTMITPQVFWLTGHLRTPAWALWSLAPALIVLAVLALAWPAVQVSRLKPIDHLRV